jgi:H+/Cl- antiporter ClcA
VTPSTSPPSQDAAEGVDGPPVSGPAWLHRQLLGIVAATLAGAVALFFYEIEQVGLDVMARSRSFSAFVPAILLVVAMVAITALRDRVFPGTDGTGIPQVMAALTVPAGRARDAVLSLRVIVGKILLLSIGLLTGMTVGREGPSVHVGGALMDFTARFGRFPRSYVERGLILAGGGAGIAASFNAPIAGAVFAIEELGRSFEKRNASLLLRTVLVASLVPVAVLGDYVFYGKLQASIVSISGWGWVVAIGLAGGLLGGAFARALLEATKRWRQVAFSHPWLASASLGLALAALDLASGGLTLGGGFDKTQTILHDGADVPLWFAPLRALASFVCLLSGIPGGLFDPSLTVGAGLGQALAPLLPSVQKEAVILLVMVSYFSGVVQSPITAGVILLEMTRANDLALPILVASILAYEASHRVCPKPLYEGLSEAFQERLARRMEKAAVV